VTAILADISFDVAETFPVFGDGRFGADSQACRSDDWRQLLEGDTDGRGLVLLSLSPVSTRR